MESGNNVVVARLLAGRLGGPLDLLKGPLTKDATGVFFPP